MARTPTFLLTAIRVMATRGPLIRSGQRQVIPAPYMATGLIMMAGYQGGSLQAPARPAGGIIGAWIPVKGEELAGVQPVPCGRCGPRLAAPRHNRLLHHSSSRTSDHRLITAIFSGSPPLPGHACARVPPARHLLYLSPYGHPATVSIRGIYPTGQRSVIQMTCYFLKSKPSP